MNLNLIEAIKPCFCKEDQSHQRIERAGLHCQIPDCFLFLYTGCLCQSFACCSLAFLRFNVRLPPHLQPPRTHTLTAQVMIWLNKQTHHSWNIPNSFVSGSLSHVWLIGKSKQLSISSINTAGVRWHCQANRRERGENFLRAVEYRLQSIDGNSQLGNSIRPKGPYCQTSCNDCASQTEVCLETRACWSMWIKHFNCQISPHKTGF